MPATSDTPLLSLEAYELRVRSNSRFYRLFAASLVVILLGLSALALLDMDSWHKRKAHGQAIQTPPLSQLEMASTPKTMPKYLNYVWPGKNKDALRTGASEYSLDLSILQGGPTWSFHPPPNSIVRAAPLIDDKMNIYLATVREGQGDIGSVRKFSPDGKLLWTYMDTSTVPVVPTLYDGSIIFSNIEGLVTMLDMETGDVIWSKSALIEGATIVGGDTWSMAAADGLIITAVQIPSLRNLPADGAFGGNNALVALDTKSGEVVWYLKPDDAVYNMLVAISGYDFKTRSAGSILFSTVTGIVYRVDLKTGQLIWKVGPGKPGQAVAMNWTTGGTIIGHNGVAYTTSNAYVGGKLTGFVTAFEFNDGSVLWRKSTAYEANNAAVIGEIGGRLALAIGIGLNPESPNPIQEKLGIPDNSSTGVLKKNRVITLEAETGEMIWSHELPPWYGWGAGDTMERTCLPDAFGNAALSHDGTVFVGNQNGHLIAINDKNGNGEISPEEIAEYDMHQCSQGTAAIAPGMLVFTPCDGMHVFKA